MLPVFAGGVLAFLQSSTGNVTDCVAKRAAMSEVMCQTESFPWFHAFSILLKGGIETGHSHQSHLSGYRSHWRPFTEVI